MKPIELRLPRLISDGMVLQREREVNIWGWAIPGASVTVHFLGSVYRTGAGEDGRWKAKLPPMKAGGPYSMKIESCGKGITVNDILIGEVWVCSGQSNMVLPMYRVCERYAEEIALSYNLSIRLFIVPDRWDFNEVREDLESGRWESPNPESILHFPATGYFFAKALFERYHVPVGYINASVGGSPIEAWLSGDSLESFPQYKEIACRYKDERYVEQVRQEDEEASNRWHDYICRMDRGLSERGNEWYLEEYDDSDWPSMILPAFWAEVGLGPLNGVVWFRKEFLVGPEMAGKPARLLMGRIVDSDTVYVNGLLVGTTAYQYPPRRYAIPGNVLKAGRNVIVARVVNTSGKGGFAPGKPYKILAGDREVDLSGEWRYCVGAAAEPLREATFFQYMPSGLFNGMLSPLLKYTIRGVNWYQGESNTSRPSDYRLLLAELIRDWREKWKQGELPFLYVQLPNYLEEDDSPAKSGWPEIREAQRRTLSVPNTGMAVAIDAGEWNDLHPLNKKEIGSRLALLARKIAYGEDIVFSGPLLRSVTLQGTRAVIEFEKGSGTLVAKGNGELRRFEIAGEDGVFVRAKAAIEENKVVVWSDGIDRPSVVRYAWADNPEGANLYNREGLPASPFRAEIAPAAPTSISSAEQREAAL
jgi:sialate O-acetylesterase